MTQKGEAVIQITAKKTGKPVIIPLHPNLKAVLEECKYQAPKLSDQKLNDYIKEVAKLAGITEERTIVNSAGGKTKEETEAKYKLISTHTARRTFATISIAKGLSARTVMAITGHSTEQQLNTYIDQSTLHAMEEYLKLYGNNA